MRYRPQVVIIGAGFAGLQAARRLARSPVEVTLIDRSNYHTFQPLHQVATAELAPELVASPIRSHLRSARNVRLVMAEVEQICLSDRTVNTNHGGFAYDFLVIATGSKPQYFGVPGAAQAFTLKRVEDAIALRQQVLHCYERALQEPFDRRQKLLTVVIVGGGATGVELAGALSDWVRRSLVKSYPSLKREHRFVLLHSGDRLLNGMHPRLQTYAQRQLQRMGVEVHLQTRVTEVFPDAVRLKDGTLIEAATIVWVAGVHSSLPPWDLPQTAQQQVRVLPTLQVLGHDYLYAIGDVAAVDKPLPMLAAVAVQQGKAAARNIDRQVRGRSPLPFRYRHRGSMAILGRHAAVMQIDRWRLSGTTAWFLWLAIHLSLLPGFRARWLTLVRWLSSNDPSERAAQVIFSPPLRSLSDRTNPPVLTRRKS